VKFKVNPSTTSIGVVGTLSPDAVHPVYDPVPPVVNPVTLNVPPVLLVNAAVPLL